MSFRIVRQGELEFLTAECISGGVAHAFSTRLGGVSEGHLAALNLGTHRGDAFENVLKNYEILANAVGFRPEDTVFAKQVHGCHVARVGRRDCGDGLVREVTEPRDGLITNEPNVCLVVFSADCTPILLHDPVTGAIGAVHSGWRGTAQGIVKHAVERMTEEFGTDPANLQTAIGPCISRCCFETREDVPSAMREALGQDAEAAIDVVGDRFRVDLKLLNRVWLERAGVRNIDISADCTCCQPQRFWTHRKVGNARGSLAAVIVRKDGDGL